MVELTREEESLGDVVVWKLRIPTQTLRETAMSDESIEIAFGELIGRTNGGILRALALLCDAIEKPATSEHPEGCECLICQPHQEP